MKVEQQSTEGVAGILTSIDESGPIGKSHDLCNLLSNLYYNGNFYHVHADLVGDENELCTPTPEYTEP